MAILIEGMEMPTDDMKNIMILADCRVFQFSGYGNPKPLGTAVPVPPHGRLIDADAVTLKDGPYEYDDWCQWALRQYQDAPTVIPASKEGET